MKREERIGIAAGIVSSALGGMAAAATRYAVVEMEPLMTALFRFGIGCLLLLPLALAARARWPRGRDLGAALALGAMFYGVCFVVYAHALTYTTAARGSLGVATLPVLTMVVAAVLGRERLTLRKSIGVLVALAGVALSLAAGIGDAPPEAWRGDLLMIAAMLSMALYTIYSRPLMSRSSALGYACAGMAAGAAINLAAASAGGAWAALAAMDARMWAAGLFLGVFPGGLGFFLWLFAVERTSPTRVASTITVSPLAAGALGALLVGEAVGPALIAGVIAVGAGIWVASTESRNRRDSRDI
ncbi:MAG: DMT family transporter [Betaproteobacteria bacterium]